jgi:hypothetical protein
MVIIYVNLLSRFTNNMIQYVYAILLHEQLKDKYEIVFSNKNFLKSGTIHFKPVMECNIDKTPLYPFIKHHNFKYIEKYYGKGFRPEEINNLDINFNPDILNLNIDYTKNIVLSSYFENTNYYKDKELVKKILNKLLTTTINIILHDNDVVIHIRGDDRLRDQYGLNYYKKCLDANSFDNIYIVTDNPKIEYVLYILTNYKNSKLITSKACIHPRNNSELNVIFSENFNKEIVNDFLYIYNAKNIIMSISTFSWLAAYLSNAKKIYFPYENKCYNNLRVNEERYIYVNKSLNFKSYNNI